MKHIIPDSLKNGDKLAIVATARWITEEQLDYAQNLIESWGFKVVPGKHLHTRYNQLAGTDDQRASDLENAINDPEIKAIIVARGGYGTVRILDKVDFSPLLNSPKWICGYSDITALHMKLHSMKIASIHSTMPVSFGDATAEALDNLRLALLGDLNSIAFRDVLAESSVNYAISGNLLGGNLSVLYSLIGSSELKIDHDFILFIEDVDEMLYHIDRMIVGLKRSGFFAHIKGMCLGGFTQMKDNTTEFGFSADNPWGFDAYQTIKALTEELDIPLFSGFPAGHMSDNRALYLNVPVRLESTNGFNRMIFQQHGREK